VALLLADVTIIGENAVVLDEYSRAVAVPYYSR
jgi:hypothetical protein